MAGLTPTLQSSLSSLQFSLPNRLQLPPTCSNVAPLPPGLKPPFVTAVCAQQPLHPSRPEVHPSRRDVAAFLFAAIAAGLSAKDAQAAASSIVVKPPPPPSGGLPGTLNADQARDLDLPLTERFYIQKLPPSEAAVRAKKSVGEIIGVKSLIDKKAWPYVQNDLRLQASYLRYDLNTILSTKTKEEKRSLKALAARLFDIIDSLDFAARSKNVPKAEKYYAEAVTILNDLLAKIA